MFAEPGKNATTSPPGRRLALIIGVNGQAAPGRAPLHYAVDDGQDMGRVLQQSCCGFELFRPALLGEQATTSQVKDAVLDLAESLQEDDFALFFFSGHAESIPLSIPLQADLDDVYLVTNDFDIARARRDHDRYVSLRWLREHLFRK